jgi:hypothetical protein
MIRAAAMTTTGKKPDHQILRRYRRPLLLRLEHTHRPTLEDHVHRATRLGRRGARALLQSFGIPVVADMPGVGDGLSTTPAASCCPVAGRSPSTTRCAAGAAGSQQDCATPPHDAAFSPCPRSAGYFVRAHPLSADATTHAIEADCLPPPVPVELERAALRRPSRRSISAPIPFPTGAELL